ncbi:hypothetical protein TSUD_412120 [Trifolium subterraneum]|uniref:DUF223 domain-containing protein n=1 Tax=Trifolium subterraneum TaxID=3900 RepID=A0A2Z6P628_TRISU|nr:hypothetical protein TSUD_412120 [Trifolium subterraneum]
MTPSYDSIASVNSNKESWNLMVRVVRLWYVKNLGSNKLPFSMEMVMVDKNGDRIHATVRRSLIYKFENDMKEGEIYNFTNFGVATNIGEYRTTKHQYKLNFQYATKVKKGADKLVSPHLYVIANPSDIFAGDYDTDYLVAIELDYDGKAYGSKHNLCIEVDLQSDVYYCLGVEEEGDSPSPAICMLQDTSKISIEDDFLNITPMTTIEALKDMKMETSLVFCGVVKVILDEDDWFYTACICHKKGYPDEKMYFCEKCNKHVVTVFPRYRLKLRIIDSTDSSTFVVFDRDGAELFKKSCSDMIDSMGPKSNGPPKELIDMVDKTFLFKVDTNVKEETRYEKSYRVKKMTDDVDVIAKFKAKYSVGECGSYE